MHEKPKKDLGKAQQKDKKDCIGNVMKYLKGWKEKQEVWTEEIIENHQKVSYSFAKPIWLLS